MTPPASSRGDLSSFGEKKIGERTVKPLAGRPQATGGAISGKAQDETSLPGL